MENLAEQFSRLEESQIPLDTMIFEDEKDLENIKQWMREQGIPLKELPKRKNKAKHNI